MKIVIINHSDSRGGASVVSMRLMKALAAEGADVSMIVAHKAGNDPAVHNAFGPLRRKIPFLLEHARIFTANGFTRRDLFAVSIASDGLPVSTMPQVRDADVVMLNWVNQGMLDFGEIRRMAEMGKTIIWTMHDMWNLTGICHHAGTCTRYRTDPGCGMCPMLHNRAAENDLSRRTWKLKSALYSSARITFVAVSSWLRDKCVESSVMKDCRTEVIPNAFPVEEFYITPRRKRADMGLPEGKKLIIMGAARLDDPVKGLDLAVEALNRLADSGRSDAHAVFFGAIRNPHALDAIRLPHTAIGPVTDKDFLHELYAQASAVLSSSLYETLPGTLIEGQAAGCFPVSFGEGGQADIIDHGTTGYITRYRDSADLAHGLTIALDGLFDPQALRDSVEKRFSARSVARRYLQLVK